MANKRLATQYSPFTNSLRGQIITEFTVKIPDWLEKPAVLLVLLYRRLRYGYTFRRIPLTHGKYAIVDTDDYVWLSKYKWYVVKRGNTFYANRGQWSKTQKRRLTITMHRLIIDVPDGLFVDHINHNGLDNRKANLRPATPAENARYARYPKINTSSKYRGVWYNKKKEKWRATISVNLKRKQIGYFKNEIDAARAYDNAAKHYYKDFAILNFSHPTKSK